MTWPKKPPGNEQAKPPALSARRPGVSEREKAMEDHGSMGFVPSAWCRDWLFGLFIVIFTLIAYGPAQRAGFIWDDDQYLTSNPLLTAPDGLRRIWFSLDSPSQYFPLTYTTFYLERSFWGLNPAGYHLVNVLLHAANAVLVWRVLKRLRIPGAWLAAAIFALHPVQVESVAWITERKNVLMGFFFLLTLWGWIKFIDEQTRRSWRFYFLALAMCALALSAKTTACTLPAALLLILWLKKMPIDRRRLAQVAPFVVMGIGMGLVTVWWERYHQGTQGKLFEMGPIERLLIASRALWFYLGKLLWPANLAFSYPRWDVSVSDPRAYGWVAATVALGVVIWRLRRWTGRSVEVAAAFFAATLCPVLGFIMLYTFMYSFVADHYQYLACIGPIALAAAGLKIGLARAASGKSLVVLSAVLLMTLGSLTWKQCGMYSDLGTLWQTTLCRYPNCWLAQGNLGKLLLQRKQLPEAIVHFQKALQLDPNDEGLHQYLGICYFQLGRNSEAITQFQEGLRIKPADEGILNNLAWILATCPEASLRDGNKALDLARQANDLAGGKNPLILGTLAAAFAETGRYSEAVETAQRAVDLAQAQSNDRLAAGLQTEMKFYQTGSPFHSPAPGR
jgi:tetratricopeptide (TPR) repeat protein